MKYTLTTNHPQSSYGLPVLIDEDRNAYGPADMLPRGETAREFVGRAILTDDDYWVDESQDALDLLGDGRLRAAFLKNPAAVALGKLGGAKGGKVRSPAKSRAARANGAKGGRPSNARLLHHTDARGNDWYTVVDRSGVTVLETRDADEADRAAKRFREIVGCEPHPAE